VLVRVERGEDFDVVELIADDGRVVLCHAHGFTTDEKVRVRETIVQLVRGLLAPR
jgi:hypothetical protein